MVCEGTTLTRSTSRSVSRSATVTAFANSALNCASQRMRRVSASVGGKRVARVRGGLLTPSASAVQAGCKMATRVWNCFKRSGWCTNSCARSTRWKSKRRVVWTQLENSASVVETESDRFQRRQLAHRPCSNKSSHHPLSYLPATLALSTT